MTITKRRSRFAPKPRKNKSGRLHHLQLTHRDVAIFRLLQRYRYLPINFLYALLPDCGMGGGEGRGNYRKFQERLTDLAGQKYLSRPPRQFESYNAFYKKLTYELGREGKLMLAAEGMEQGIKIGYGNSYHHEALTCLIIASIELSCQKFQFIHWPEILNFNMVPSSTKDSATPFNMPLIAMDQKFLISDGTPFCIKDARTICFPGVETDMGTETLTGKRRVTIKKKFEAYRNIAYHKTYKKHFGFPNMVVPFVTTSEARMENMITLLDQVTDGKGCSYIIFKHTPHLRSVSSSPDPIDLLAGDWQRSGHPPFNLHDELKKTR